MIPVIYFSVYLLQSPAVSWNVKSGHQFFRWDGRGWNTNIGNPKDASSLTLIVKTEESFDFPIQRTNSKKSSFFVLPSGTMRVTGCLPENNTDCDISVIRTPLNVSSTISVTLNRKHSGAEFRCEAQLDLGPEGPQPPPNMMSGPLNLTVHCEITFPFAAR